MNHLPNSFYTMPGFVRTTFTKKQLKETLLDTGGYIISCGSGWDIKNKHLGAGVYEIYLEKRIL